jgi:hypothetical protein
MTLRILVSNCGLAEQKRVHSSQSRAKMEILAVLSLEMSWTWRCDRKLLAHCDASLCAADSIQCLKSLRSGGYVVFHPFVEHMKKTLTISRGCFNQMTCFKVKLR